MKKIPHQPVLLEEVVEAFRDRSGYIIDATLGYGGHSEALLRSNPDIRILGIDRDGEAIAFSKERLAPFKDRVKIFHGAFGEMVERLLGEYPVVGVLADIGVSSLQLDKEERGFALQSEKLDMRMDPRAPLSADDVVNRYDPKELERIFRDYGEIRNPRKIVEAILKARPIKSARELAEVIAKVAPKRGRIHPATTAFQAIRIEVNRELEELEKLLDALERKRPAGARVGVISFHSLEDRIVKERFKKWSRDCICDPEAIWCECGKGHALGTIVTKKPIVASSREVAQNPRSRSAKMRIFQFGEDDAQR